MGLAFREGWKTSCADILKRTWFISRAVLRGWLLKSLHIQKRNIWLDLLILFVLQNTNFTDANRKHYWFLLSHRWHLYLDTQTVFITQPGPHVFSFLLLFFYCLVAICCMFLWYFASWPNFFQGKVTHVHLIQVNSLQPTQHICLTCPGTITVSVDLETLISYWDISISEKSWTLQRPHSDSPFLYALLQWAAKILLCSSKTIAQFQI